MTTLGMTTGVFDAGSLLLIMLLLLLFPPDRPDTPEEPEADDGGWWCVASTISRSDSPNGRSW